MTRHGESGMCMCVSVLALRDPDGFCGTGNGLYQWKHGAAMARGRVRAGARGGLPGGASGGRPRICAHKKYFGEWCALGFLRCPCLCSSAQPHGSRCVAPHAPRAFIRLAAVGPRPVETLRPRNCGVVRGVCPHRQHPPRVAPLTQPRWARRPAAPRRPRRRARPGRASRPASRTRRPRGWRGSPGGAAAG